MTEAARKVVIDCWKVSIVCHEYCMKKDTRVGKDRKGKSRPNISTGPLHPPQIQLTVKKRRISKRPRIYREKKKKKNVTIDPVPAILLRTLVGATASVVTNADKTVQRATRTVQLARLSAPRCPK